MNIGSVSIPSRLALAPMAGVTDRAFRSICRELGAGYTVTEMVSAKALCYQDKKTIPLLKLDKDEHPAAVQLFGSEPDCMAQAAKLAIELSGADILDINMGCPVPKVAGNGEGSGLMQTPQLAEEIVHAVCAAVEVPVTVKIRLGWNKGSINCVEFAQMLEQAGAAAIAVHGRTRKQMYSGHADWSQIRRVVEAVRVPVIANGDVFEGRDAKRILEQTGAEMAMIGRGCFGNPWLFQQAQAALDGEEIPPLPPLAQRCETFVRQFERMREDKGDHIACLEARRHYAWYLKGISHAKYWKEQIVKIETPEDVYYITKGIARELSD